MRGQGEDQEGPVAIANCVSGPRDLAAWITACFRPFLPALRGIAGFRAFELLEVVHEGPHCMYVSLSTWDDPRAFSNWRSLGSFASAHDSARADSARFTMLSRAARYDFPAAPVPALEQAILSRVAADYPDIWTAGASLRPVLAA